MPRGPRLWILVIVSVFVALLAVYESSVPVQDRQAEFDALPSTTIQLQPIGKQAPTAPVALPPLMPIAPAPVEPQPEVADDLVADPLPAPMPPVVSVDPVETIQESVLKPKLVEHIIESGDTLEAIFVRYGFPVNTLYNILEADQEYLVLEPLQVGDRLNFETDKHGELVKLSRRIDPSKTISYVSHDNGGFVYEEDVKPISWSQLTRHGEVKGSFYVSAKRAGLSDRNVMVVSELLKNRFDFRRDLRAGDTFDVVLKQGDVDGELVGAEILEAVRISVRGNYYQAFLHSDGRFYDENGNSLTPALRRWPTSTTYRISSAFNPRRMHPVTGRPSPHNGTDIATPNGTQILATGDGVVTRTADHRYAGKYIEIDNIGKYSTRFLHLSKILVKKGQRVKRGQVIALSGSTGRVTGPHLHYELHINGRPVNPMTAKIPTMQAIAKDEQVAFNNSKKQWTQMMDAGAVSL
ncbi:peptidase M23 [Maribrevibacterium harenarium]|uniref:Peptidase M23 n=1 Tax=Maribrevibacterium harenarium TaxID=2589817 RepID=A0A501WT95_9GAMM|nr:peptidase M23 [Maribrevibacterium harenarium]